ncbi:T9SS type A sorting domain-containing protein [Rhodohalobacter sp. 8-1]|uniref:T9SS type A sorting domain-containing protein n=1 Tax=Rhodohalobacter sp. 8-1 TaxID=3131972 RepID=UPI0030EB3DE5
MIKVAEASTTIFKGGAFSDLPVQFELFQNYPNPFNPSTTINFALPEQSDVTIRIYDVMGRRIATLMDENRLAGYHNVVWDARRVASET